MSLSPKVLSLIQKAGTTVFHADAALKDAVADAAKKVSDAMTKNPFDGQHDSLFQDWKNVSRIAQAMGTIESELKNLYALAVAQPASNRSSLALAAPAGKAASIELTSMDVTDVVAKPSRKFKGANKPSKAGAKKSIKRGASQSSRLGGGGNTAKVLAQLQTVLNDQTFTKLNQTAIAVAVGLPKGSIGASIKKLIQDGRLVQGEAKEFKLSLSA